MIYTRHDSWQLEQWNWTKVNVTLVTGYSWDCLCYSDSQDEEFVNMHLFLTSVGFQISKGTQLLLSSEFQTADVLTLMAFPLLVRSSFHYIWSLRLKTDNLIYLMKEIIMVIIVPWVFVTHEMGERRFKYQSC